MLFGENTHGATMATEKRMNHPSSRLRAARSTAPANPASPSMPKTIFGASETFCCAARVAIQPDAKYSTLARNIVAGSAIQAPIIDCTVRR